LLKQQPDARLESVLLHNMGLLAQDEKDYDLALKYYVESLKLAMNLPEQYNQGMILTNMGMLFFERGHLLEALGLLLSAVQVRQGVQDPTVNALILFLETLEKKMGAEAFAQLYAEATGKPGQMFAQPGIKNGNRW